MKRHTIHLDVDDIINFADMMIEECCDKNKNCIHNQCRNVLYGNEALTEEYNDPSEEEIIKCFNCQYFIAVQGLRSAILDI